MFSKARKSGIRCAVALGLGLTAISYVAIPLSAVWLALGFWLGRKQAVLAGEREAERSVGILIPPSSAPHAS